MNGKELKIFIADEEIAHSKGVCLPVGIPASYKKGQTWNINSDDLVENSETIQGWRFYMRRGGKHYFCNVFTDDKIVIIAQEMRKWKMRYGDIYEFKIEF